MLLSIYSDIKKRVTYLNRGESFRHSSKSSLTVILVITKNTVDANNYLNSSEFLMWCALIEFLYTVNVQRCETTGVDNIRIRLEKIN